MSGSASLTAFACVTLSSTDLRSFSTLALAFWSNFCRSLDSMSSARTPATKKRIAKCGERSCHRLDLQATGHSIVAVGDVRKQGHPAYGPDGCRGSTGTTGRVEADRDR